MTMMLMMVQSPGGATPLMYACQQCRENEVLEMLRRQPHLVRDRDRTLKTPLHYCAENPNSSCAEAVLKMAPELVNAQDENGYSTLHLAVIAGNKPLVKLLLGKGADVNIQDNEGHSAVHWAIVSSEREALEMIIRAGANPSTPDIHGGYPLHYAVQMCGCHCDYVRNFEDTVRVVEALLNFGVDVSVKDKDGRQPILWAASAGSADAIIHLVSGGACVEAADKDGLTALHCAASRGHTSALETLITLCGANVDVIDGNGCSALFYSVTLGHADATELLLQLGAEPNRQDRKGRTPAHCGAAKGQLETLRILQKHGGNLWMRNVKGDIPLHEAVASGRKDLVLWLLSQCSEAINIANNDGRCPLHIASMYNNTEMVKVLLDCKSLVNPVMRTSKGVLMTPLNVALSKGHRSCGKYLQLHGGVPFSKVSKVEQPSVFAVRVSPSDDAVIVVSENNKENVTPSQTKIAKSRSSTDIQEVREGSKGESTTDKKKVYRRRKKKKNQSNVQTQDSDTDDSVHDVKIKTPESRKSEKSNETEGGNGELQPDVRTKTRTIPDPEKTTSGGGPEVSEERVSVSKVTKSQSETKSLQKNKSFNETKNVSDLSPEDFPPLMQTINHLDIVIMEPDIDGNKTTEKETKQENAVSIVVSQEETTGETKEKEGEEEGGETSVVVEATTPPDGDGLPSQENVPPTEEVNKSEKSTEDGEKGEKDETPAAEKSGKTSAGKKGKDDTGRKSSEEGSGRKKSPKSSSEGSSSTKKDSGKTGKKSNGSSDEKRRKATSPKESKTSDKTENKSGDTNKEEDGGVGPETKPGAEESGQQDEKTKTEDEVIADEIISVHKLDTEEVKKRESAVVESPAPEIVTRDGDPAEESSGVVAETVTPEIEETKSEMPITVKETVTTGEPEVSTSEKNDLSVVGTSGKVMSDDVIITTESGEKADEGKTEDPPEMSLPEITIIHNTPEKKQNSDAEMATTEAVQETVKEKRSVEFSEGVAEEENKETTEDSNSKDNVNNNDNSSKDNVNNNDNSSKDNVNDNSSKENVDDSSSKHHNNVNNSDNAIDVTTDAINISNGSNSNKQTENSKQTTNGGNSKEEDNVTPKEEEDNQGMKNGDADNSPRRKTNPEERQYRTPRVSRLCRRNREFKDDMNQISVTQLVQNTIRKYHMERGIFYQLLELKRYQIRSGKANEQVLVKRLADEYERSRVFLGMKPFTGVYKFREFEKFLYDQLKALNSRRSFIIPEVKSYDDIDALSGFLKKSRYKIINETPPELVCTCITQRCHHSACAYTNVPCSAYITDLRRHRHHRPRRESFFPRIDQKSEVQKVKERPATLELVQGSEKHVITLPQDSPAGEKRYYVTFTIKGGPALKEEDLDDPKDYFKHRHAKSV